MGKTSKKNQSAVELLHDVAVEIVRRAFVRTVLNGIAPEKLVVVTNTDDWEDRKHEAYGNFRFNVEFRIGHGTTTQHRRVDLTLGGGTVFIHSADGSESIPVGVFEL